MRRIVSGALSTVVLLAGALAQPASAAPAVDDAPSDLQNMADAYGRITGPGGQLRNPAYLPALVAASSATTISLPDVALAASMYRSWRVKRMSRTVRPMPTPRPRPDSVIRP